MDAKKANKVVLEIEEKHIESKLKAIERRPLIFRLLNHHSLESVQIEMTI